MLVASPLCELPRARTGQRLHGRVQGLGWRWPGVYVLQELHLLRRDEKEVPDRGGLRAGRPGLLGISKKLPIGIGGEQGVAGCCAEGV